MPATKNPPVHEVAQQTGAVMPSVVILDPKQRFDLTAIEELPPEIEQAEFLFILGWPKSTITTSM